VRGFPLLIALAASCGPSPSSPAGLREALSSVGIDRVSLVEVRFLPTEGTEFRLASPGFWRTLEDSGPSGHRCSCVLGIALLVSANSSPNPAATIVVYDGFGMKLKTGSAVVEFEAPALREAIERTLAKT
jgi:hypothetical protein